MRAGFFRLQPLLCSAVSIQTTTKHFARLQLMIADVVRNRHLRVNPQLAARFMAMGIIRPRWIIGPKGPREIYDFTPYGWLVANRPEHWHVPRRGGDAFTLARRWSRSIPELEAQRLAAKAARTSAPKPTIPGLDPPRRDDR